MKHRNLFQRSIEYTAFAIGVFLISTIAVITNLHSNDCAEIQGDRQDFVCTESSNAV